MQDSVNKVLYGKILKIMEDVKRIPKNGYNSHNNYQYATEADVKEGVRNAMIKHGLVVLPSCNTATIDYKQFGKDDKLHNTRVLVQYKVVDVESGESEMLLFPGHGSDVGDKGIYKAFTGSMKYMLMELFMLPTGDDPEKSDVFERPIEKPEVKTEETTVTYQHNSMLDRALKAIEQTNSEAAVEEIIDRFCGLSKASEIEKDIVRKAGNNKINILFGGM